MLFVLVVVGLLAGCGSPAPWSAPSVSAPSVQATPNPFLVEFETHIADATRRQGQLVQALARATDAPPAELRAVAGQLADWATTEIEWLGGHPPDACYQAAVDAYRAGVQAILASATAFVTMAGEPSPRTESQGQAAGQGLADGQAAIEAAAAQAKVLRASCRS